jgi:hypothetical protein
MHRKFRDIASLVNAARHAESKLRDLGNTFNSTNFTDRYGDGPICLGIADEIKRVLPQRSEE